MGIIGRCDLSQSHVLKQKMEVDLLLLIAMKMNYTPVALLQ